MELVKDFSNIIIISNFLSTRLNDLQKQISGGYYVQ